MTKKPAVGTPSPQQMMFSPEASEFYKFSRQLMEQAVQRLGLHEGASAVLSGVTRELRRHGSIEDIQAILHGFADTLPEAAKYDVKDGSGR